MRGVEGFFNILPNDRLLVGPMPILPEPSLVGEGLAYYTQDQLTRVLGHFVTRTLSEVRDYPELNAIVDTLAAHSDPAVVEQARKLTAIRDAIFGPPEVPYTEPDVEE